MGCSESKQEPTIGEEYTAANLPQPLYSNYENEFEKQLYMAINLCRINPKSFVPLVNKVKSEHELVKTKETKDLIEHLKKCEPRSIVSFDE